VDLRSALDRLASTSRELAATQDALSMKIAELEGACGERDQIAVKHRQLTGVGRCSLTVSKPVLKAPVVSAISA